MATTTGTEYDHIDLVNGSNTTRHYLKDPGAREQISDLKSAFENGLAPMGLWTLLKDGNSNKVTTNGVVFERCLDGIVSVQGTATQNAIYDFYNNNAAFPAWVTPGETYALRIFCGSNNVRAQVYVYSPTITRIAQCVASDGTITFTPPLNASGFRIRLAVDSGLTVSATVAFIRLIKISSEYYKLLQDMEQAETDIETLATGFENIEDVIDALNYSGAGTLVVDDHTSAVTTHNITFAKKSNGLVSVSATAAANDNAVYDFYNNSTILPDWIKAGQKYSVQILCPNDNVRVQVYQYNPSSERLVNAVASNGIVVFKLDSNAVGFRIRIVVENGINPGNVDAYVRLTAYYGTSVETAQNVSAPKLLTEQYNKMIDINHRGLQVMYPENSIPAFTASAVYGYHFVETDVQQTQDGVFILLHDGTTQRTTGTTGNVADMTLTQIKALSLLMGSTDTGYKIPTLAEGMACFKANNLIPFIELKKETITTANVSTLIAQLEATGQKYIIMSLEHGFRTDDSVSHAKLLEAVRDISPTIPIGVTVYALTSDLVDNIYSRFGDNTIILVDERTNISQSLIEYIHEKGLLIGAFTPATYNRYNTLMTEGYDFALSNFLMNNHEIQGQTTLYYIGTNDTTGVDSWSVEISSSDAMRYRDVVRIRGLIKCASEVVIDGNTGGGATPYQTLNITPTEWTPIDMQIYLRGSDPIQLSITPASGKLYYRNLSYTVTKCQR